MTTGIPKLTFIAAVILLIVQVDEAMAVDCTPADIEIGFQSDIDNFQINHGPCDTVTGWLRIMGPDITTLLPLSDLRSVNGYLHLDSTSITSLEGISGLTHIGQWFQIFRNQKLTDLEGFPEVEFGNLNIWNNDNLHDIQGLSYLSGVVNSITLSSNDQITNVDPLSGISAINGSLIIKFNSITSLQGLANLSHVDSFVDIHERSLLTLAGLENLETVGGYLVIGTDALNSGYGSLENIDGILGLKSVGSSLLIGGNQTLKNIDGLSNLEYLGGTFILKDTVLITDLNVLSGITSWGAGGGIRIESNQGLSDISALSSLPTSISSLGFHKNDKLTDLSPLGHLVEVRGYFYMAESKFTDISPLAGIQSVDGDFTFFNNRKLNDCGVFESLLDIIDDFEKGPGPNEQGVADVSGEILIHNNVPGCNSLRDITDMFLINNFED